MSLTPEERAAKHQSAAIDKDLRAYAREYENTIKILLLGKQKYIWYLLICGNLGRIVSEKIYYLYVEL
jgi:hypothetical protein